MPPAGGRITPPIFFPEKENGRCDRPKERFALAVSDLNNSYACGMKCLPGVAAVSLNDLTFFYPPLPLPHLESLVESIIPANIPIEGN